MFTDLQTVLPPQVTLRRSGAILVKIVVHFTPTTILITIRLNLYQGNQMLCIPDMMEGLVKLWIFQRMMFSGPTATAIIPRSFIMFPLTPLGLRQI